MSPEVMNCADASTASDMWGVGCITYQLLSGGISPFFAVNRFRTMARYARYYFCDFFCIKGVHKTIRRVTCLLKTHLFSLFQIVHVYGGSLVLLLVHISVK